MNQYKKIFKESSLIIDGDNDVQYSDETLDKGIKITLGKGKFIPYHSKFVYNKYDTDILSIFQVQDKTGVEIVKRFKGISSYSVNEHIYNNLVMKISLYISFLVRNDKINIILVPNKNSIFLNDVILKVRNKLNKDIIIFSDIEKSDVDEITIETNNILAYKGSEQILNRIKKTGSDFKLKKIPKQYARNFRNFFKFNIKNNFIEGSNILIIDDVLSSGVSIRELVRLSSIYNPMEIKAVTVFKMK